MPSQSTQITDDGVKFAIEDENGDTYEIEFHVPKNGKLDIFALGDGEFRLCETDSKGRKKIGDISSANETITGQSNIVASARSGWNETDTTLTLVGSIDELIGYDTADVHFEWGEVGADTRFSNSTTVTSYDETDKIEADLTGLTPDTDYEFKIVAERDTETATDTHTCHTDPVLGVETTETNTIGDTATLDGDLTALHTETTDGDGNTVDADASVYFEWDKAGNGFTNSTTAETLSDESTFSHDLSGLSADTQYEVRAVAESEGERAVGTELTFTTEA